ncbi:hypothetical protein Pla123a_06990 [Posidoniimonas polymericola]|uniref:Uncharacterized protein n=1 Tax=Posidoniimonas polymericola TaxID=2528002 RepID=A0A5C5ZEZ4_9BACT|nr:hypothetical protein [Posidoniimonas polymericola]TWT85892.1 hypothetical protein Pla123a_06990 [Posidoniimonas polymericola]
MTESQKQEIDSLLSAIADEGASVDRIGRLESLLLDQPELQDYYASQQTVLAVLELEYSHVGQPVLDFTSMRPQRPESPTISPQAASGGWPTAQVCAAALAAVFFFGLVWSLKPSSGVPDPHDSNQVARVWSSNTNPPSDSPGLVVEDKTSLRLLEKLTRHPLLTNIVLPQTDDSAGTRLTLCSGNAWFERVRNRRERGYLVALPQGCLMQVAVDTDARGKNSLAVVELNHLGNMTGKALMFDNSSQGDHSADIKVYSRERAAGQIGSFSEFNDSSLTKYYLLTGSFALEDNEGNEQWQQSDYLIQFDEEDLLVIGWDDSGYDGLAEDADMYSPDRDFNDIRAVLKFSFPQRLGAPRLPVSPLLPEPMASSEQPEDVDVSEGFSLDLRPGEEALLTLTAEARFQTGFRIVDAQDGKLLWSDDGVESAPGLKQPTNRGVYVVRNLSEKIRRYKIQGRHKPFLGTAETPWRVSPHVVSDSDNGTITVGFEDSPNSIDNNDWRDLQVYVKLFSP